MAEEGLECIVLEHSLGNPFFDWSTNMNIQKAVNFLHSALLIKKNNLLVHTVVTDTV